MMKNLHATGWIGAVREVNGKDLWLRTMTDLDVDTNCVVRWRNQPEAREAFFSTDVVTPDTHRLFMATRAPHDLVYMIECDFNPIGMCSLTVDIEEHEAEWGRIYVDPEYTGQGYARAAVLTGLEYAFEVLCLRRVFVEVFADNNGILNLYKKLGFTGADCGYREIQGRKVIKWEFLAKNWEARA